jgi:hypothetical protein
MFASFIVKVVLEGALDGMHDTSLNCMEEIMLIVHPLWTVLATLKEASAAATEFANSDGNPMMTYDPAGKAKVF